MAISWQDNSLIPHAEWVYKRNNTIGASEVGAIVFGSKWTSNLEIWHNKVTGKINNNYNLRMYIGTKTEQISADMWEYFDGVDELSVIENERLQRKIKKCENINSTAFNSDFPFLSATPDRIIQPYNKYEGKGFGCLEIKNTMQSVLKSYETLLPTENVIQLVTQMMCTNYQYGELMYFIDNAKLSVHSIEKKDTKKVEQVILLHTKKFWDSVLLARPIYNQICEAKRTFNNRLANELEVELAKLEPDPQSTVGYLDFLTQQYKDRINNVGMLTGTEFQLDIAKKHKKIIADKKKIEAKKIELEIQLINIIRDNVSIDFGKNGKVTYYPSTNGNRLLKNKLN